MNTTSLRPCRAARTRTPKFRVILACYEANSSRLFHEANNHSPISLMVDNKKYLNGLLGDSATVKPSIIIKLLGRLMPYLAKLEGRTTIERVHKGRMSNPANLKMARRRPLDLDGGLIGVL